MSKTIQELAEQVAIAESRIRMLGEMNAPLKWEDQIKASARYKIAEDALYKARQEYGHLMAKMSAEDLMALTK